MKIISIALALHLCLCNSLVQSELTWTQVILDDLSPMPSPRRDACMAFDPTRNQLVLFGGKSSANGVLDDTWIFDIGASTWRLVSFDMSDSRPQPRFTALCGVSTSLDVFALAIGEGNSRQFFNDVWELDLMTEKWNEASKDADGEAPHVRYGAGGGLHLDATKLLITHGFAKRRFSDTFTFDLVSKNWQQIHGDISEYNPNKPHARCLFGSTVLSPTRFAMFGGCLSGGKSGGPCPSRDGWTLDFSDEAIWKSTDDIPSARLYSAMTSLYGSAQFAVLYGGLETTSQVIQIEKYSDDEICILDVENNEWTRYKTAATSVPTRRSGHCMTSSSDTIYMFSGEHGVEFNDLWALTGSITDTQRLTGIPVWFTYGMLHGIFMFLGWGVCLQAGAFIARYFKFRDPWWFTWHKRLQIGGLVLATMGVIFGIVSTQGGHFQYTHAILGLIVTLLGLLQPLNAHFRPHKNTSRRKWWNYVHWSSGRIALALAIINISLGFFMILAPSPVWIVWFILVALLLVAYICAEYYSRTLDPKWTASTSGVVHKDT